MKTAFVLLFLFFAIPLASAQTVIIGDYSTAIDSEVTVLINISDAESVAGGVVNISFNPSIVSVEHVAAGDFGDPVANINNISGWVKLVAARSDNVNKNEAVLANVIFRGMSAGTTDIQILYASLNNEGGALISPLLSDGNITVTGNSGGPQDRSLIQVEGLPEVYWFQNSRLYWVTDWNIINDMSAIPGWDSVNTLPASEFNPADYEQGPRFITTGAESNDLLIREQGDIKVYLILNGEKHHFTSPEALTWNGYGFDDVIDVSAAIVGMFPEGTPISISVGEGATTPEIEQLFIDAYERNGGLEVLDNPATGVHRAWGYLVQDFPGASGYAGGIIIYNPYKNYAYYIHGAIWERYYGLGGPGAKTDIEFEVGPPISDILPYIHTQPPEVSSHGTQFRYQNFEGGALNHNIDTGEVFEIHGAIFAKWGELGYADDELGLVTSDEREAALSPIGTEGRVSDFEGGHIHWHRTGGHGGESYETHGAIDAVYCSEGGSGGDLGFPVSDEYVNPSGYPQSDFEGGYITTTDWVNYYVYMNDDVEGPSLEITSPEDGFHTDEYRIDISGTASDDSGILYDKVGIASSGFEATPTTARYDPITHEWNTNIPLVYGINIIRVVAWDKKHNPTEKTISIYCNPPHFSFAQITDVHLGNFDLVLSPLLMSERQNRITKAITQISHRKPQPDFILVTGDLVDYNKDEFFSKFNDIFRGVPYYVIPGNHDRRTNMLIGDDNLEKYKEHIQSSTNFDFPHKGYTFIGLDSGADYDHWVIPDLTPEGSGLEEYQLTKLKSFDENTPKIIFMHHPVVTEINDYSGSSPVTNTCPIYGGNDDCIALNRCEFIRYCTDYNVQLVLTGHTHKSYDDNVPFSNTRFIQTPSVTIDKDRYSHGYRIIDIKNGKAYPQLYTKTDAHSNLQGSLKCPAHLHAYDSQGRHTGLNASGGVETNIPDSFYIGRYNYSDPNETETILLYDTTEEYRFKIIANLTEEEKASPEIESFNFTVEQQTDDTRTTIAHLSVPLTENTTATLPINLTTIAYTMEIDYDGDSIIDETRDPDFTETNYAPTASIIAPETGSIFNTSGSVEFNGTGRDPEDGILTNFSLVWYSDINGVIGAGERFSTANLSCGVHRITLMVNDSVDLVDTDSMMITVVDITAPSSITNLTPTASTTWLNFTWTNPHDPDFNHTELYLNGTFLTNIPAPQNYYNITGLLPNTSYELGTHTVDTSGNINETWVNETARTLLIPDTTPPTITFISPTDPSGTTLTTRNWTFISVSLSEPGLSWLEWNGINESMSGSGTNWHINKTDLVNGVNSYRVCANDSSGNENSSETRTIELDYGTDNIPPIITITSPINDTLYTTGSVDLNYTVNEPTYWEGYSLGGIDYNITLSGNTTLSGLNDGSHILLTVYANDTAGNMNSSTVWFTVDTTPPSNIFDIEHTAGITWLNWTWTNPPDPDFRHTEIYLDGTFQTNTSAEFFNATDLVLCTKYIIGTRTVDINGNINPTWVNDTAATIGFTNITFLLPIDFHTEDYDLNVGGHKR